MLARDFLGSALQSGLFCFQNKTPALVEIDPPGGASAIRAMIPYRAFEDICIFLGGGGRGFGSGNTQDIAKLGCVPCADLDAMLRALRSIPLAGQNG